jgi:NAD(P)H-dependent FMN reductase
MSDQQEQPQQPGGNEAVHVVGIGGSLRAGSYTRMAVTIALQGAADAGASTQLIDLRDYDLPFCGGKIGELESSQDVLRVRGEVERAQGIILGTPVYHGSFSGVLKNALDAMGFAEFEGKVVGLVGISGGALGAADALTGLQVVCRALHAWVVPLQVSVPEAWKLFEPDGHASDPGVESRLKDVGRQVVRFAYLHTSRQALEFLREWEEAPANPGGDILVQFPS